MQKKIKILMVTVVWGDWHLNAHLTANLPTLMASGNLPDLTSRFDVTYRVYTRRSDTARLLSAPIMEEISRRVPIELKLLTKEKLANPIGAHQWAWQHATRDAKTSGRFILFIPPDVAWSDGSFARVADLLDAGKSAVFMTYLRVVSDTFLPALHEHRDSTNGVIPIAGREMVALSLRHVHPLMAAYSHDSPYFPIHAEMILWPVAGEGLLVRVLAREIFLWDPGRFGLTHQFLLDGNYAPEEVTFIDDSDSLFAVSLAPLGKDVSWHMQHRKATPLALARWWLAYDSTSNDLIAATHIRWHLGTPTARLWRRQEIQSDRLIRDAMADREGLRIWRELHAMQCRLASSMLALAIGVGLLAKAFSNPRAGMIFVPSDEAMQSLPKKAIENLALPENAGQLIAFLRHHVVFDDGAESCLSERMGFENESPLSLRTAAGHTVTLEKFGEQMTVNGADVLEPAHRVGRYRIYPINGVLDPAFSVLV
jgi:hypothetical protein